MESVKRKPRSLLTRRQKQVLDKFRMGYTAWAPYGRANAFLCPGEHVIGRQEIVRTDTLDMLVVAGWLRTYGEFLHDVYWEKL